MTNNEFENYLALLSRLLRLKRGQKDQIAGELRDHLESRVSELLESGVETNEATRIALEEFGDAASLAGQFQFISENYQRRWMMRFATLSVAGLFLVAVLVMSMWPAGARFGSPDTIIAQDGFGAESEGMADSSTASSSGMSDSTQRNMEVRKKLRQSSTLQFDELPFSDVMSQISEEYKVNVVLTNTARDDALTEDEPVTFNIKNIPLSNALRLMLYEYNATYTVQQGVLKIISLDVENDAEFCGRRIYDISDLLVKIRELEEHRIGEFPVAPRGYGGGGFGGGGGGLGGGGGGGGIFAIQSAGEGELLSGLLGGQGGNAVSQNSPATQASSVQAGGQGSMSPQPVYRVEGEDLLIDSIKQTIGADSWDDTNGDGKIQILGGLMIVNQTEKNNDELAELIQDLEYRFSLRK